MLTPIYTTLNTQSFIICSLIALMLGFAEYGIFSATHRARKDYSITLILFPFIISVMLMGINSISNSFIILGIFALTRFRTVQYKADEICAIFTGVVIGILCSMGYLYMAVYAVIIYSLVTFIIGKANIQTHKQLRVLLPEDGDPKDIEKVIKKHAKSYDLINYKTANLGSLYKLTYDIMFTGNAKELIDEIRIANGNLEVSLQEFEESKS